MANTLEKYLSISGCLKKHGTVFLGYPDYGPKYSHMENKKNKNQKDQQPINTPVNLKSGDKLRENPANDEETISQNPKKSEELPSEHSSLPRQHEEDRNQVTNEDDQKDIVNPTEGDWDVKIKPETDRNT
jgi:hypothetical protein